MRPLFCFWIIVMLSEDGTSLCEGPPQSKHPYPRNQAI